MSFVEAIANVVIGYGAAVVTQMLVFPWFGMHITLTQNLRLAIAFTFISFARSFVLRRLFEAIRFRKAERETAALARRRQPGAVVFRREFCRPDRARQPFPK